MKKWMAAMMVSIAFILFLPSATFAHELSIQIEEEVSGEELRVDVIWGHIRDFVDEAEADDFELYVQEPNGDIQALELEGVGVQGRAYVPTPDEGDYTFWASKEPSTYTPDGEDTQLSKHFAKAVSPVGNGSDPSDQQADLDLDIVPNVSVSDFSTGTFEGTILFNETEASEATIAAYGPDGEVLETTPSDDGLFELDFESTGEWLITANVVEETSGTLENEDYEAISRTTSLLIDTEQEEVENTTDSDTNVLSLVAMGAVGIFLGAAGGLIVAKRPKRR